MLLELSSFHRRESLQLSVVIANPLFLFQELQQETALLKIFVQHQLQCSYLLLLSVQPVTKTGAFFSPPALLNVFRIFSQQMSVSIFCYKPFLTTVLSPWFTTRTQNQASLVNRQHQLFITKSSIKTHLREAEPLLLTVFFPFPAS